MEHIEFLHSEHFENNYHRQWATGKLLHYIDFCWETDFDELLATYPEGFSDVLFPNIGYTYIINLGTPFVMQLEKHRYDVKTGGFLPRHHYITCHHSKGNQLFGIKFKVCPILFEKQINFAEYKDHIYPLAYLIDNSVIEQVKKAGNFKERVKIIFNYYSNLIERHETSLNYVQVVTGIIKTCSDTQHFDIAIETLAQQHNISIRTLQRYFEATTGFTPKTALQTIRTRQAVKQLIDNPGEFDLQKFGYYDNSHFSKSLKKFAGEKYYRLFLRPFQSSN